MLGRGTKGASREQRTALRSPDSGKLHRPRRPTPASHVPSSGVKSCAAWDLDVGFGIAVNENQFLVARQLIDGVLDHKRGNLRECRPALAQHSRTRHVHGRPCQRPHPHEESGRGDHQRVGAETARQPEPDHDRWRRHVRRPVIFADGRHGKPVSFSCPGVARAAPSPQWSQRFPPTCSLPARWSPTIRSGVSAGAPITTAIPCCANSCWARCPMPPVMTTLAPRSASHVGNKPGSCGGEAMSFLLCLLNIFPSTCWKGRLPS